MVNELTSVHITFPTHKWQSVNKHINRLRKWRENRLRRDLDVSDLNNAIAVATAYMESVLGHERRPGSNDAFGPTPSISVGWMEQVLHALENADPTYFNKREIIIACTNMHALIGDAKRVNEFARTFRRETELKLIDASQ